MILQRIRFFLKRVFFSSVSSIFSIFPLPEPTQFAVITRGRTGSSLLLSLLHSHPNIRVHGEVIGEDRLREPYYKDRIKTKGTVPYIKEYLKRSGFESAVGIKILYYQVEQEYEKHWETNGLSNVLAFLKEQKEIKIIHLKRHNYLECFTSIHVAARTKKYTQFKTQSKRESKIQITLPPEDCDKEFNRIDHWESACDQAFKDHDLLEVYYETLATDMKGTCNRILDFLNIPNRALTTRMKKQQQRPLSEVIKNFEDLKKHYEKTKYAWFFETQENDEVARL